MPEAAPGEGLLSVEGVRVTRGRQVVLRGIDLVIQRGAPFAIAGESGSGKTTLLFVIAGLLRPDAGAVTVGGSSPSTAASKSCCGTLATRTAVTSWSFDMPAAAAA